LTDFLNDIFGTPTQINMDPEPPDTPTTPASTGETITPDEKIQALTTCKASGAPGTDNITNDMLKKSPPNKFDLEKAFDKVSHEGIIHRLTKVNLPSHFLDWLKSFLTDRTFHVTWSTSTSSTFTTKTGVPQGSCLSSTLFNIFFSDISVHIPSNIHRALYADDLGNF